MLNFHAHIREFYYYFKENFKMASTSGSNASFHTKNLNMLLDKLKELRISTNAENKGIYKRIEDIHILFNH